VSVRRGWAGATRYIVVRVLVLAAIAGVLIGGRWVAFSVQDFGTPNAGARSTGHDALWLGHSWVGGHGTQAQVAGLAATVRGTGISDFFVHVGPLSDDGSLDPAKAPGAAWFVRQAHTRIPGVRVLAWLGDEVAPSGGMDVESPATRARIVGAARQVLALGFDGVHLDLEPVGDADPGYLLLLSALRPVVHAADGILSVSAEQVEPLPGTRWAMEAVEGHSSWWSAGYLRQVASRVGQGAIMSYDTALWSSSAYSGFVRDETETALAAVPANVWLLMGLPAFHDAHTLEHSSSAETVAAALRGVRLGLAGPTPRDRDFGVALYAGFAASSADWSAYRAAWAG
jgi:hypothetical protein